MWLTALLGLCGLGVLYVTRIVSLMCVLIIVLNLFAEAQFAFSKHKEIVPLQLEAGHKPRGWLGVLVGARPYLDVSNPSNFKEKVGQIVDQLKKILNSDKTGMNLIFEFIIIMFEIVLYIFDLSRNFLSRAE